MTLLELFFDLVYVVALTLVSRGLVDGLGWERALQSLLILMALWWTWAITTLVTDMYDPERTEIKLLIVAVMFGALLMTTTIPEAFAGRGLVFAATYVAIHLGRGLFLMPTVRHHRQTQRRAARIFIWFAVSACPWIVGGLVNGHAREASGRWRWPSTTSASGSPTRCPASAWCPTPSATSPRSISPSATSSSSSSPWATPS